MFNTGVIDTKLPNRIAMLMCLVHQIDQMLMRLMDRIAKTNQMLMVLMDQITKSHRDADVIDTITTITTLISPCVQTLILLMHQIN